MAKTIVIDIQADTKSAKTNIEELTETIEEQNKVLLDFEKELLEVNQKLDSTSKSNLQARKKLIDQRKQLQRGIKEQRLSLKGLNAEKRVSSRENKKMSSESKDLTSTLDGLSGGMISGFKKGLTAVKGLSFGFKGLRGAVIATGIGALLVLVTAAIEYFSSFDKGVKLVQQTIDAFSGGITQLATAFAFFVEGEFSLAAEAFGNIGTAAKQAAEDSGDLFDVQKELQELQIKNIPLNAELNAQLKLQQRIAQDTTESAERRIAAIKEAGLLSKELLENENEEFLLEEKRLKLAIKLSGSDQEKRDLKIELSKVTADLITQEGKLNVLEQTVSQEAREIANAQLREQLDILKELKTENINRIQFAEMEAESVDERVERNGKALERRLAKINIAAKKEVAIEKALSETKAAIIQQDLNNVSKGFFLLGQIAGKNRKLQATALIGESAVGIAKIIVSTKTANAIAAPLLSNPATVALGIASIARNNISAGLGIAANVAATAKGLKALKAGGSPPPSGGLGGSGGGVGAGAGAGFQASTPTISAIPTFNPNQNNNQNNVRAYVVQNDISNQNALDKRIRQRATL